MNSFPNKKLSDCTSDKVQSQTATGRPFTHLHVTIHQYDKNENNAVCEFTRNDHFVSYTIQPTTQM